VTGISNFKKDDQTYFISPGGFKLKIGVEYGLLDVSEISSNYLGNQPLITGPAVIYANRITAARKGNRCLVGPIAAKKLSQCPLEGPFTIKAKKGEKPYAYYELVLDDIWRTGKGKETYWG
jgi:hypothetical protein